MEKVYLLTRTIHTGLRNLLYNSFVICTEKEFINIILYKQFFFIIHKVSYHMIHCIDRPLVRANFSSSEMFYTPVKNCTLFHFAPSWISCILIYIHSFKSFCRFNLVWYQNQIYCLSNTLLKTIENIYIYTLYNVSKQFSNLFK